MDKLHPIPQSHSSVELERLQNRVRIPICPITPIDRPSSTPLSSHGGTKGAALTLAKQGSTQPLRWSSRGTCRTRAGSRSPFVGGHGSVRRAQPPRRRRGQASQRFPQPPFLLRVNDRNIVVAPPCSGKGNDGPPSGWEIVRTVGIPVELHSGTNTVTISGNTPWAPDIDRVIVR